MAQKNTKGGINTKVLLVAGLAVLLVLAGWLYYNNRNKTDVPVEFQTETGAPPLPAEFNLPVEETPAQ